MKQIITLAITLILIIGCSSQTSKASYDKGTYVYNHSHCQVHILNVKGHEYLVSYTISTYGGTCIIHAAHCPCQTKQNNK